jgi:hypothetical protein
MTLPLRTLVLAASLLALGGCFSYTEIPVAEPQRAVVYPPGSTIVTPAPSSRPVY